MSEQQRIQASSIELFLEAWAVSLVPDLMAQTSDPKAIIRSSITRVFQEYGSVKRNDVDVTVTLHLPSLLDALVLTARNAPSIEEKEPTVRAASSDHRNSRENGPELAEHAVLRLEDFEPDPRLWAPTLHTSPRSILDLLKPDWATHHSLVPLRREGRRLFVGTAHVAFGWENYVKRKTGFDAVPVSVRRDEIRTMIEMQYFPECAEMHTQRLISLLYGIVLITMTGFRQMLSAQAPEVLSTILERGQCVPICITQQNELILGMVNPRKRHVAKRLQELTGFVITPAVITPIDLPEMLRLYFNRSSLDVPNAASTNND